MMDDADRGGAQPEPSSVADDSVQEARREAEALGADAVALAEAYSPARFQQRAGAFGLSAGVAMDLRLGWDLGREADQVKDQKRLSDEKPYLLILSPKCLAFSQLQALNTKPERLAELLEQGRQHMEFACILAESQIERGGRVLFEHPWMATSWNELCLRKFGMRRVRCDQCQFGMTSVDDAGNVGPAQKATGFMTNDEYIAEAVDGRCFGGHDHIQLLGNRAKACEKHPPRLVAAILRALRWSMRAAGCGEAQGLLGKDRQLTRELEMQYMDELKVLDECMTETGRAPIPTDWVDINKGDSLRPNYRSRLVCQETRGRSTIDVEDWAATFAATFPYEASRLQLSLMMTGPRLQVDGDDQVLMLLDISRAHLHSSLARAVFVTIGGKVYKLLKARYGLRDAGAAFDRKVLDVMNLMGVSLGKFSICVGYRKAHVIFRDECLSEVNTACLVQMVGLCAGVTTSP